MVQFDPCKYWCVPKYWCTPFCSKLTLDVVLDWFCGIDSLIWSMGSIYIYIYIYIYMVICIRSISSSHWCVHNIMSCVYLSIKIDLNSLSCLSCELECCNLYMFEIWYIWCLLIPPFLATIQSICIFRVGLINASYAFLELFGVSFVLWFGAWQVHIYGDRYHTNVPDLLMRVLYHVICTSEH